MRTDLNEQIRELIEDGARPISFSEVADRRPTRVARAIRPRSGAARSGHNGRRRAVIAAGLLAAVGAAAIAVTQLGGAPGAAPGQARPGTGGTVLTAAMIRHVAAASGAALAHVGHVRIGYTVRDPGRGAGTADIRFSGKNWNYVLDQTAPPNGKTINRVVGGRLYYHLTGQDGLAWYRETSQRENAARPSANAPDPRKLLGVLAPDARFARAGHDVICGVRVMHLRATRLGHLSGLAALPDVARPYRHVTSLDVWVDAHGVIRRMHVTSQHADQRASATVSFLDIGRPETIAAPAHAIPVFSRG